MKNIILCAFCGLIFIACNDELPIIEKEKPYAELHIEGKVTDSNLQAINKVQIIIHGENEIYDTLFTNNKGEYEKTYFINPAITDYSIKAEDIDGESNGGYFKESIKEFSIEKEDFIGASGKWYAGKVTKIIDFKLSKK